ncbi:MAG: hypothetical protein AUG49_25535 [Catenulispora sp. 13_1_20CM_3_70_7]|jgi:hypothetical protein|nr:MAG: hypothetical protein AUG49_25535 [Catenulispora sp. 13_1_20CM_3_70_7]
MCCEHLVCANCAGPVSEGRCSLCRGRRDQMHHQGGTSFSMMVAVLLTLFVAVAFLTTTIR